MNKSEAHIYPDGSFLESEILVAEEAWDGYNKNRDFVSLDAWKKCRKLRLQIYEQVIPNVTSEEKYAFGSQIRRASQSITLNIAEGYGRFHYKEGLQFYRIARGSLYEIKDLLIMALDMKFIDQTTHDSLMESLEDAKATLAGFMIFVQKKINSPK